MRFGADIKMAAILVAEVAKPGRARASGGAPSPSFLQRQHHEVIDPAIAMHGGRTFELEPDHTLAEFTTPLDAVRCAQHIRDGLSRHNAGVARDQRVELKIGIHYGEVTFAGGAIEGPGLDIARRLENLAGPGEVCVSGPVRAQVEQRLGARFVDLAAIPGRYVPRGGLAFRLEPGSPGPRQAGGWLPFVLRFGMVAVLGAIVVWLALAD